MSDITMVQLKEVGMFATPDDMESLQKYLGKFSGGEALAAQTGAWMAWNLAAKLVEPHYKMVSDLEDEVDSLRTAIAVVDTP